MRRKIPFFALLVTIIVLNGLLQQKAVSADEGKYDCTITIDANNHNDFHGELGDFNYAYPSKGCETTKDVSDSYTEWGYYTEQGFQIGGMVDKDVYNGEIVDLGFDKLKVKTIPLEKEEKEIDEIKEPFKEKEEKRLEKESTKDEEPLVPKPKNKKIDKVKSGVKDVKVNRSLETTNLDEKANKQSSDADEKASTNEARKSTGSKKGLEMGFGNTAIIMFVLIIIVAIVAFLMVNKQGRGQKRIK